MPLRLAPNPRARRYVLRLTAAGVMRVTIPRGGTAREAREFAARHAAWIEKQLLRRAAEPEAPTRWTPGSEILFRGTLARIDIAPGKAGNCVSIGREIARLQNLADNLRPELERWMWGLASRELPPRVFELARQHGLSVHRVSVRNQRSRWGSCSRRGTVSLNWRLIQAPSFVRDYIILHELAHLKQMNHSRRFWSEVAKLCPGFEAAEAWLKSNASLLSRTNHP